MTFWGAKLAGVILAVASVAVFAAAAAAQEEGRDPQAALRAQVREQNVLLDGGMEDLSAVGAELEDTQTRVYETRARAWELRSQRRDLARDLILHREIFEASKARYEEQARAAYKGDDLEGLAAFIRNFLGGGETSGSPVDFRVAGILLDGQDNLDAYGDNRQTLRDTIRQLSQKNGAYNEVLNEEKAQVANLRRQEAKLDATIARIRSDKDETETRLEELETRERERIRKTRSATGGSDPPRVVARPRDVGGEPRDSVDKPRANSDQPRANGDKRRDDTDRSRGDDKPRDSGDDTLRDGADEPRSGGDTLRETEAEVAQEEIFVQPVESVSRTEYEELYKKAAKDYGFARDWYILAAVGKVESNHGENVGPSSAGAQGPMQFLPSTWESSGVDGDGDGDANIMDPRDAIPAAAGYLRAGGAPDDWYAALYSYNHADWYVKEVLAVAEGYRTLAKDDRVGPYI